jgi:hypothetical protein
MKFATKFKQTKFIFCGFGTLANIVKNLQSQDINAHFSENTHLLTATNSYVQIRGLGGLPKPR